MEVPKIMAHRRVANGIITNIHVLFHNREEAIKWGRANILNQERTLLFNNTVAGITAKKITTKGDVLRINRLKDKQTVTRAHVIFE
jgi:hypothetical protein